MTNEMLIILILSAVILAMIGWIIKTEIRLAKLLGGKSARTLEDVITALVSTAKSLEKNDTKIEGEIENIETRLKKSIQGVETVRFNPFRDSGGNHSFATALVSENGDGVVISTLYARDRVNIFAKPIKNNASEFELTVEEKTALERASK